MANGVGHSRDVAVIIPAAGMGSRMGGVPKQFRTLGKHTLLRRSVGCFTGLKEVMQVVVVVPEGHLSDTEADLKSVDFDGLVLTVGGATRQESVRKGLEVVSSAARVVLVHDAARPFASTDKIREVVAAVRDYEAASLAIPVADTLRKVSGTNFAETVSREGIYRMQTPQGFRPALLVEAHREAAEAGWKTTDDVDLVMRQGHAVCLINGHPANFKITTPDDWELAEMIVQDATASRGPDG
ncbi:MAG: 2-C-methyl-D-erythritol 4-phosphate cytidylyltransferase [Rhodothermia bacterium]|nr:2-C-methyl-D-erythritol 4-phosphate cytidylyltransferase [Rhodothermia bacterium]